MTKQISSVSRSYAKALFQACENSFENIKIQLQEVLETIQTSGDLQVVMNNNSISTGKKLNIIDSVFAGKIDLKVLNLLKILVEKNRFNEFSSVSEAFAQITDLQSNKKNVEIISSIELRGEIKNQILDKLQRKLSCEVIPNWQVDENIIAGLKFKFEDYVIDSSVSTKLKVLGKNISR